MHCLCTQIGSEVRSAVKRKESYRDSLLAEECLRVAVNHTCKVYTYLVYSFEIYHYVVILEWKY